MKVDGALSDVDAIVVTVKGIVVVGVVNIGRANITTAGDELCHFELEAVVRANRVRHTVWRYANRY